MPHSIDRLGRYVVQRRLGAGGFATVWLAYDEKLDSNVAIKVLADNWASDPGVARRFVDEGRYLRRVESQHVVSVYDAGELADGRPYLVMTYADQGTLADRLDMHTMGGSVDIRQARSVIEEIATGLQDLHDRDILHRDVKPANVLFRTRQGRGHGDVRALVGDLGLGKALDSSRLTMIAGSPSYVAPEQAAAEPLDARADQYSLAAVAYRLLAGRPAFAHTSLQAAVEPGPIEPISGAGRFFSDGVEDVVRRGLAPSREDRFDSVADFAAALGDALDGMGAGDSMKMPALAAFVPAIVPPTRSDPGAEAVTEAVLERSAGERTGRAGAEPVAAQPPAPRRRRRWPGVLMTVLVMVVGAGAAGVAAYVYAGHEHDQGEVRVSDADGRISAQVPGSWDAFVSSGGWRPPNSTSHFDAVSAGETKRWNTGTGAASGIFAGIMPGKEMPESLPTHEGCEATKPHPGTDAASRPVLTGTYACTQGALVEQVTKLDGDKVLWVQVRAQSVDTADRVLASVKVS